MIKMSLISEFDAYPKAPGYTSFLILNSLEIKVTSRLRRHSGLLFNKLILNSPQFFFFKWTWRVAESKLNSQYKIPNEN